MVYHEIVDRKSDGQSLNQYASCKIGCWKKKSQNKFMGGFFFVIFVDFSHFHTETIEIYARLIRKTNLSPHSSGLAISLLHAIKAE